MAAAILALLLCCAFPLEAQRPPNFIIILADDLGYGDLSTYGGWIEVPQLDRLAAEGLKFTDFHSNGAVCSPTRAALLTGRYQQRAGIPGVVFADPANKVHRDGLQPLEYTFAEVLEEKGYALGMFGKWHLGYYPKYNPVQHGFDVFRGYVSGNIDFFSHVDQAGASDWWHNAEKADERGYVTHLINRHAARFVEEHKDQPFCLYLPHEAPHYPYQGPDDDPTGFRVAGEPSVRQELSQEAIRVRYRQMVEEMDKGVGAILEKVKRLGLAEDTLVFFFSDNGATPNGSNGSLRGYKSSLWEGGHRVPAIAWWPGKIEAGGVTDQLAAGFDLMPTMAELADASLPKERPLDGVSLAKVFTAGQSFDRGPLFWKYGNAVAMRDGTWKYIDGEDGLEGPGLFDLGGDIGESRNLAQRFPERVRAMAEATAKWVGEVERSATEQPSARR